MEIKKVLRRVTKTSRKAGMPPGALVHVGRKRAEDVKITLIDYSPEHFEMKEIDNLEDCLAYKDKQSVTWINIDGLHKVKLIEKLGELFDLHPLLLEDVLNTRQRPKTEEFGQYILSSMKMITFDEELQVIESEQISLILAKKYVISFQEKTGDLFDPIRGRMRDKENRIRKMGTDYLVYRLIDTVVDHYFFIIEKIGDKLEDLEDEVIEDAEETSLQEIQSIRKDLISLRRSIYPLREAINRLERDESGLIQSKTRKFLQDVYDHTVQIIETMESFRDMVSSLRDSYMSTLSNKMNKVMQVLTIIATIFIPLTFMAGIYGMNFDHMPELHWKWSYPILWGLMIVMGVGMLIFFRRKRWM